MRTTSSRDNWERLVAAVIKRDQIRQLCHQDSITTVDSDFTQRDLSLRSVPSSSSRLPLTKDSVVQDIEDIEVRKNGSGTITQKIFSALLWRKKHKDDYYDLGKELVGIPEDHFGLKSFSLRELQLATDNFHSQNFLGRGGFGEVYKGRLADGSLVAVKRYKELAEVKFENELEILSIVKHRNVIDPLGLCITEKERLIVCPYMANGSVASCLRERRESQPPLGWETRLQIALGVAWALDYLHHGCIRGIIHRDVKAANILLDEDFKAVVSDFGLATFMDSIDNVVKGTIGHIAPEYLSTGKCSLETDVFGYGVFLLELITAQRVFDLARLANDDDMMLLDWVKNLFEDKTFEIIVDQGLEGNFVEEVEKLFQIALICTQIDPKRRPTMSEIVRMLEYGDSLDEGWEKLKINEFKDKNLFKNVYSSKLHPSADWIITDSSFDIDAEELSGPR